METKNCANCQKDFPLYPDDLTFYEKIGVPAPKMCPPCRARHRLAFRNERTFYKRKCDKCVREVISMYSPNKPYPVWCYECWFADDWDAADYGQDYDPSRPFLEQLREVYLRVPKVALIYVRSVRSEYVNISADNKDSYMLIESSNNESCIHSYWVQQCRDSVDLSFSHQTELAYESDDCYSCYQVLYSKGCYDSSNSYFLLDCRGVTNSIGCVNLRNAQYCVFNEPVGKESYEKFIAEARLDTASGVEALREKFRAFVLAAPRKFAEITNAPGSSGNYITDAKNCRECFHSYDAEDCAHGEHVWRNAKDCVDVSTAGRNASLIYNSINTGIDVGNCTVCAQAWSSTFLEYCLNCFNSNHCFGSAGVRKKEYCILNRQYSKDDYEALREQIVKELQGGGRYGEFFPASLSAFGYNETVAQEQFPLTKEEAANLGFGWEEYPRGTYGKETRKWAASAKGFGEPKAEVPDSIKDFTTEDINAEIFACTECSKNYRVIPAELQFYQRLLIPLPRLCPDCRHLRRFKARGPNRLFEPEQCGCGGQMANSKEQIAYTNIGKHEHGERRCPNMFRSNYAPGHPEVLYCETCYNAEVA